MSLLLALGAIGRVGADRTIVPLAQVKSGSGFLVTPGGDVVTSAHVIAGCPAISVWAADGAQRAGSLVAASEALDIALIHAPGAPTDFARAPDPGALPVGAAVFTLGYGVWTRDPRRPAPADGTFAGVDTIRAGVPVRVVIARLQHGQSGGPVIDAAGRLVGMVIGRYTESSDRGVILPAAEVEMFLVNNGIRLATELPTREGTPQQFLKAIAVLVQCTPPPARASRQTTPPPRGTAF